MTPLAPGDHVVVVVVDVVVDSHSSSGDSLLDFDFVAWRWGAPFPELAMWLKNRHARPTLGSGVGKFLHAKGRPGFV